jgi:hypothetical protein
MPRPPPRPALTYNLLANKKRVVSWTCAILHLQMFLFECLASSVLGTCHCPLILTSIPSQLAPHALVQNWSRCVPPPLLLSLFLFYSLRPPSPRIS